MSIMRIKDYNSKETIAAIATVPAASALGVIKISGLQALRIAWQVFLPKRSKDIRKVKTYTIHYGWIADKSQSAKRMAHRGKAKTSHVPSASPLLAEGETSSAFSETSPFCGESLCGGRPTSYGIIDEVLLSVMRKPHTYTGEDVVEISSHGGPVALNAILEVLITAGCRLALPGEFTYRALCWGRIDLLQAESILDIVNARSEAGLMCAGRQLRGQVSTRLTHFKEAVSMAFAQTEAMLSFPEDQVPVNVAAFMRQVRALSRQARQLLSASDCGRVFQEGIKCVICGKTNAGKSTLFNCLLRDERVIVSRIPGTTRDVIEETINIRGVPLRICDTAGILEPRDILDKKAIEKTSRAFEEADLVIVVLDASRKLSRDDYLILDKLHARPEKKVILVANKSDVGRLLVLDQKFKALGSPVAVSALRNTGIAQLEKAIVRAAYQGIAQRPDGIFLSQFQRKILRGIADTLVAIAGAGADNSLDFVNLSLRQCLDDIGKLCGEVFSEDVLESIFSRFCIGK